MQDMKTNELHSSETLWGIYVQKALETSLLIDYVHLVNSLIQQKKTIRHIYHWCKIPSLPSRPDKLWVSNYKNEQEISTYLHSIMYYVHGIMYYGVMYARIR